MSTNIFLLSWDCYGLEACVDITDHVNRGNAFEKEKIFDLIKDPNSQPHNRAVAELNKMYSHMALRAQFNPQRNYEIYVIHTNEDITKADLVDMFETNPQGTADLIRERGTKLYSDRQTSKRVIA
jgi:hypothetical protein